MPIPANLSKLSNVVNNEAVKKTEYDKLVTWIILILVLVNLFEEWLWCI